MGGWGVGSGLSIAREVSSGRLGCWERSQYLLEDGTTKKAGVEMAGRRTLRIDTDCWPATLRVGYKNQSVNVV